jgi:hypothetical protein
MSESVLRKAFLSWGAMLAIIPFIALFGYGAVVVSRSVQGAAKQTFGEYSAIVLTVFIISAIVFYTTALLIARHIIKGGGA